MKTIKSKHLLSFLLLALGLFINSATAKADTINIPNTYLTIETGIGNTANVTGLYVVTESTRPSEYNIVIPQSYTTGGTTYTITGIAESAFNSYSNNNYDDITKSEIKKIKTVTIPPTVVSIGARAFMNCTNLSQINGGENITTIGEQAFQYCSSIKSMVLPHGLTSISDNLFSGCTSLEHVAIPYTVVTIGFNAFLGCGKLTNISIPFSVEGADSIGTHAIGYTFSGNEYKKIEYPATTPLTIYGFKTSGTYISGAENYAEKNDLTFKELFNINNGSIEEYYGKDEYLYIPSTDENRTTSITKIISTFNNGFASGFSTVDLSNTNIGTIGSISFWGSPSLTKIILSDKTEVIEDSAFMDCENLKEVIFGNNTYTIGEAAFMGCTGLEEITLPSSMRAIGNNAFDSCSNLSHVVLNEGLTTIGTDAFLNCDNLTSVTIPSTVTTIGEHAFGYSKDTLDSSSKYTSEDITITSEGDAGKKYTDQYSSDNNNTSDPGKTIPEKPEPQKTDEKNPTDKDITLGKIDISSWDVIGISDKVYTGAEITQSIVVSKGGSIATISTSYSNNTNAGTATVTITGTGDYTGTITKAFNISKADQSLTVKTSTKKVKQNKLKKKKQIVAKAVTVTGAQGSITYGRIAKGSSKNLTINKTTGKITVKKKTKKGTYKIKVKITAAGDNNYNAASKTVTAKIKVK